MEFAGGGVDHPHVQVADKHQDGGRGVGAADAGVVEFPLGARGEFADAAGSPANQAAAGLVRIEQGPTSS